VCVLAFAVTLNLAAGCPAETPAVVALRGCAALGSREEDLLGLLLAPADQPPACAPDPLAGFHYGIGVGINSIPGGIGAISKDPGTNIV